MSHRNSFGSLLFSLYKYVDKDFTTALRITSNLNIKKSLEECVDTVKAEYNGAKRRTEKKFTSHEQHLFRRRGIRLMEAGTEPVNIMVQFRTTHSIHLPRLQLHRTYNPRLLSRFFFLQSSVELDQVVKTVGWKNGRFMLLSTADSRTFPPKAGFIRPAGWMWVGGA